MKKKKTKKKDRLFRRRRRLLKDFDFGKDTAAVFEDMLDRSVPFYREIQRMTGEIAADFSQPGTNIYDLGCSTGTTLFLLDKLVPEDTTFVGLDYSAPMLEKARDKFRKYGLVHNYKLIRRDLNKGVSIDNASVVIMNLTLQFIRPLYREKLLRSISEGTNREGCLILIEKVLSIDSTLNRLFIKYYYDYKRRQGYNNMEIAQKREALENVLIPYRIEENRQLLLECGFRECDVFFKWYNFCGMLAIK